MFESLSYENAPHIAVTPPGPKSRELLAKRHAKETRAAAWSARALEFAVDTAKGATIKDVDGNIYIDWIAGVCVLALGHNNPAIAAAVKAQMDRIWHTLETTTELRIQFLDKLDAVLPGRLKGHSKVLFTVTGGEACETAVSLARRVTGKDMIITFEGGYHGIGGGVVSLTSGRDYLRNAEVKRHGVFRLPYPYAYRFPLPASGKGDESKVTLRYLQHLFEDNHSGLDDPAGILVEPVLGEGGYVVPPDDFLPGLREIADKYQIPLIVDEVQTGLGRTGKFWGCELTSTTPDIMCISKSIGGGIPLSMIVYREEYDEKLPEGFHPGTYRGNALGMAAGAASIDYILKEGLLARTGKLGEKTKSQFQALAESSDHVGEVRGIGFMIGCEIVESKNGKAPSKELATKLRRSMVDNGLLMHTCGHYSNVLRFMAPLTISESLVSKGFEVYSKVIKGA
jgi:4-aminobutyrate aminotransferase-like enzyme